MPPEWMVERSDSRQRGRGTGFRRKLVLELGCALLAAVVVRRTLAVVGLLDPSVVSVGHGAKLPQTPQPGQLNPGEVCGSFWRMA